MIFTLLADGNESHMFMLINCWILDHVCSFFNKTFRWFKHVSTFALKSEHIRFLQDFIAWPKCLETGTTKTEKFRDRKGSDRNGSDRIGLTEKVAYPKKGAWKPKNLAIFNNASNSFLNQDLMKYLLSLHYNRKHSEFL